jgi:hypothetical protein
MACLNEVNTRLERCTLFNIHFLGRVTSKCRLHRIHSASLTQGLLLWSFPINHIIYSLTAVLDTGVKKSSVVKLPSS